MKRRKRPFKASIHEDVKSAASETAKDIYRIVALRTGRTCTDSHNNSVFPDERAAYHSAMQRGTSMGLNENPDFNTIVSSTLGNENNANSCTNTTRNKTKDHSQDRIMKRKKRLDKKPSSGEKGREMKSLRGAWMCGCCGAAFIKNEDATNHELQCIYNTFSKVGATTAGEEDTPMVGIINAGAENKTKMILTDENLLNVARSASKFMLRPDEIDAERELILKTRDRAYYDLMASLEVDSSKEEPSKKIVKGTGFISKIKNRLSDAYTLIKEGDCDEQEQVDQYDVRRAQYNGSHEVEHDSETQYINIIVKHSVLFVNNELERLAKERWRYEKKECKNHFERVRAMAHVQALRFAQMALSSDVQPSKVAVQLSNDLQRLLPIQLRRYGAEVSTEIEYRKDAFFILSVDVLSVDWIILMKHFHDLAQKRKDSVTKANEDTGVASGATEEFSFKSYFEAMFYKHTCFEAIEKSLVFMYHVHWLISVPLLSILFNRLLRTTIKRFIITAVTDDFFQYVERNGMEMDLEVVSAHNQAAFMLEALRQIRENDRDLSRRISEAEKDEEDELIERGPLLGPLVDLDSCDIETTPDELLPPPDLETVCHQQEIPVGYRRLRRAFLNSPKFFTEAVFHDGLNYRDIEFGPWDEYDGVIGLDQTPEDVDESEFVGSRVKCQYLMPRSVFVKENTAYEDIELTAYNDFFFSIKKEISNPEVPYGKTFTCSSQITIFNRGDNSCLMVCSCEANFPNGPPIVKRQILSEMRKGNQNVSIIIGQMLIKYATVV